LPVLTLVVGFVLGLAAAIGPRFAGIDPIEAMLPKEPAPPRVTPTTDEKDKGQKKELDLRAMINDVKKQRALLDEREKPLAARETQLKQERESLTELKTEISGLETRIRGSILGIQTDESKNIKKMAKMWAEMEPDEVIGFARGLDLDTASKVIATMDAKQSAPIMAKLGADLKDPTAVNIMKKLKQLKPPEAAVTEAQ